MTANAVLSVDSFATLAGAMPAAAGPSRYLMADALGHGGRSEWTLERGQAPRFTIEEHVDDLASVLDALEVEGRVDLVGYSMGGRTAFEYALVNTDRVRSLMLLAPGLMLTKSQVDATLAAVESGAVGDIVYNYRTEEQAVEMARLVGYTDAKAMKLAPFLAAARQAYPEDYWYHIWTGYFFSGATAAGVQFDDNDVDANGDSPEESYIKAGCAKLHDAGVSVFVAQGTADEVIASEVPAAIGSVFPSGVVDMEGHGHRGHPTDPEAEFLPEACAAAGGWLGSLVYRPQSKL